MQTDRQAQRLSQRPTLRRHRPSALVMLAAAVLIAAPFPHFAYAQGTTIAPAAAIQPAAPAPAPTARPSAMPSAAPATNAATSNPQSKSPAGAAPSIATPAPPPAAVKPSIGGELLPQKLSLVRMYLDADRVVKTVMIGLAFASLMSWTVFLAKTLELSKARRDVRRGLRILVNAPTFAQAHDQLHEDRTPVAQLMQAAAQEIRLSANALGGGLKERIALQLERLEMAASRKSSRGTGVLATIGSTAVFVGLFGTVWGIMNSFISISNAHTTNLAVVAPGIAQALLATATGLIAAIPAVVIYNVLSRQTAYYRALLGDASAQIMRMVSRDLDRAKLPLAQAAD